MFVSLGDVTGHLAGRFVFRAQELARRGAHEDAVMATALAAYLARTLVRSAG